MMNELEAHRDKCLKQFQDRIGTAFRDQKLLDTALTHKSYRNERINSDNDNERMEFLGDSILNFLITDLLYRTYPDKLEGELTKVKAYITSGEYLYKKAMELDLGDILLLGRGEENTGGREKRSLLSNAYEALIGALYIDSGYRKVRAFINRQFKKEIKKMVSMNMVLDHKAALQEFLQNEMKLMPVYKVEKVMGPAHHREYLVSVAIGDKVYGPVKGPTKKQAEKNLAKTVLEKIGHGLNAGP